MTSLEMKRLRKSPDKETEPPIENIKNNDQNNDRKSSKTTTIALFEIIDTGLQLFCV